MSPDDGYDQASVGGITPDVRHRGVRQRIRRVDRHSRNVESPSADGGDDRAHDIDAERLAGGESGRRCRGSFVLPLSAGERGLGAHVWRTDIHASTLARVLLSATSPRANTD